MREIEFRAWDKQEQKYIYSGIDYALRVLSCEFPPYTKDHSPALGYDPSIEGLFFDIEQFTGLRDKNGKEIYEGDVVKKNQWVYVVRYNSVYAQYRVERQGERGSLSDKVEVIGNIHENPKLLEHIHEQ